MLNPPQKPLDESQIEAKGRPSLVVLDMAQRIIARDEKENPRQRRISELEKGKIALKYVQMNGNPRKYGYYKRFMDNKGDVQVPGFDPLTGKAFEMQVASALEQRQKDAQAQRNWQKLQTLLP